MSRVTRYSFDSFTTDSAGSVTFDSTYPLNGYVLEVRQSAGVISGTATYLMTRKSDGGTILNYTATANPWSVRPRHTIGNTSGGTIAAAIGGSALVDYIPVDDYVRCQITFGGSVVTALADTFHVYLG